MSTETGSARKSMIVGTILVVGLVQTVRMGWQAYDNWPRGTPQTTEEFRQVMKEKHATDRENLERDWIASGKPLPPGGFDSLFKPQRGHGHESESEAEAVLPQPDTESGTSEP